GANEVSEEVIADGIAWAQKQMQPAIKLQKELLAKVKPAKLDYELILPDEEIQKEVDGWMDGKLGEALRKAYPERNELVAVLRDQFHEDMTKEHEDQYE